MKALLMYPERDFDPARPLPPHAGALRQDLGVDLVVAAMAGDDPLIADVALRALLLGPGTAAGVLRYRQDAVRDAIVHSGPVRSMYAIASAVLEDKRKSYWGISSRRPSSVLYSGLQLLELFLARLRALRDLAAAQAGVFQSTAFRQLTGMLRRELDDAYLAQVEAQLEELRFTDGVLLSARLGPECASDDYVLRRPHEPHAGWLRRLWSEYAASPYTIRVAPRDVTGGRTLEAMRDRGIRDVAAAVAESATHIEAFFTTLRTELAFHVGCANLHERLAAQGVATCMPDVAPAGLPAGFEACALRDVALALSTDAAVVGNDVRAGGKTLIVVTGANQGGKSTFLRSVGLAQLMLHAGMFVAAESFRSALCAGLYTHYKREEDAAMQEGKLDEELGRLGVIADAIRPGAWLLSNESFASTNEREGAELGRQMLEAMGERGIRVACVTHLYSLAHRLHEARHDDALFLRAERLADGSRSFRLREGGPQETSHADDLYREIFGDADADGGASASARPGRPSSGPQSLAARRRA